jgi:branched-chain amino acid transport system permease protein
MTEVASSVAPPYPAFSEKLKFYAMWVFTALILLVLPKIFSSGGALTTFSLIGISIIFSLSYNILLGQTGLLSFGHAVYYGLGGFLVIHAINIISANKLPVPLPLVPLIGGLRRIAWMGLDPAQRNGFRDDLAWRRRTNRLVSSHLAHILRGRSWHLSESHQTVSRS